MCAAFSALSSSAFPAPPPLVAARSLCPVVSLVVFPLPPLLCSCVFVGPCVLPLLPLLCCSPSLSLATGASVHRRDSCIGESKTKPHSQQESRATEPSQLQPDTPREALAHRSVSWTRAQKRLHAGQGRQEGQRQEAQQGRAGNMGNTETRTDTARSTKPTETTSPRRQRRHEDTSTTGQHKKRSTRQTRRRRTAQTL